MFQQQHGHDQDNKDDMFLELDSNSPIFETRFRVKNCL